MQRKQKGQKNSSTNLLEFFPPINGIPVVLAVLVLADIPLHILDLLTRDAPPVPPLPAAVFLDNYPDAHANLSLLDFDPGVFAGRDLAPGPFVGRDLCRRVSPRREVTKTHAALSVQDESRLAASLDGRGDRTLSDRIATTWSHAANGLGELKNRKTCGIEQRDTKHRNHRTNAIIRHIDGKSCRGGLRFLKDVASKMVAL